MHKKLWLFLLLFVVILAVFGVIILKKYSQNKFVSTVSAPVSTEQSNTTNNAVSPDLITLPIDPFGFADPLDRANERITKKPFGIYITPQNSPVQPEKFSGYHTGTDFEIFPEELDTDVSVKAVCSGKLITKEYATGYGGVAIESCNLDGQLITVIYGHLKLASIVLTTGSDLKTGDMLGILGQAYSAETSGERKHLHLGFHKGASINIRGYVSAQNSLSDWLNPCLYIYGK